MKFEWFKHYPHIGLPIDAAKSHAVDSYVQDRNLISHHSFLPLIKRDVKTNRYKLIDGKKKRISKHRPICFASHLDSLIYSYYASILQERYEAYLLSNNLQESVTAYRKILKSDNHGKCNIDFACDAFKFIGEAAHKGPICVIVSDIEKFFDNLDHKLLKQSWKAVSCIDTLSNDEYKVFRSVIRYSYVLESDLFEMFKDQIICADERTGFKYKKVKRLEYMKRARAMAYCLTGDISKIRERGLIHSNFSTNSKAQCGIPQGLPISAVLANIYMHQFDKIVHDKVASLNGIYYRYSDDLFIVCPEFWGEDLYRTLQNEIASVKLSLSTDKTKIFKVETETDNSLRITCKNEKSKIEYLGFSYDGNKVLLKSKVVNHYYLKLRKVLRRKVWYCININNDTRGQLFENQILKRFTPIGSRCHKKKRYGNYWSYVVKASKIFETDTMKRQMRHNKAIIRRRMKLANQQVSTGRLAKLLHEEPYLRGGLRTE